jgi:hypothetical protein
MLFDLSPAGRLEISRSRRRRKSNMRCNSPIRHRVSASAPALLTSTVMMRPGFFRRDVELVLRFLGGFLLLGVFATTLAWGYEQRRQAQAWRELACTYRFADVASRATFLGSDEPRDACQRLQSLGLGVRSPGLASFPIREPISRY